MKPKLSWFPKLRFLKNIFERPTQLCFTVGAKFVCGCKLVSALYVFPVERLLCSVTVFFRNNVRLISRKIFHK